MRGEKNLVVKDAIELVVQDAQQFAARVETAAVVVRDEKKDLYLVPVVGADKKEFDWRAERLRFDVIDDGLKAHDDAQN